MSSSLRYCVFFPSVTSFCYWAETTTRNPQLPITFSETDQSAQSTGTLLFCDIAVFRASCPLWVFLLTTSCKSRPSPVFESVGFSGRERRRRWLYRVRSSMNCMCIHNLFMSLPPPSLSLSLSLSLSPLCPPRLPCPSSDYLSATPLVSHSTFRSHCSLYTTAEALLQNQWQGTIRRRLSGKAVGLDIASEDELGEHGLLYRDSVLVPQIVCY
ncbi:hypothetical protein BJ546DRAFT_370043 [Cryomyces antarcticus]